MAQWWNTSGPGSNSLSATPQPKPVPTQATPSPAPSVSAAPQAPATSAYVPAIPTAPGPTPMELILGDPGFQAWKAGSDLTLANAGADRRQAIRSLFTQYGGALPSGFQDQYGDLDQATIDAAKNNPYSQVSVLGRQYDQGVQAFKRQLAARQMTSSGDTQYGLDQLDFQKGQEGYNEGNQFLSNAGQAISNYVQQQAAQRMAQAQAIWAAAQSVGSWWTPPQQQQAAAPAPSAPSAASESSWYPIVNPPPAYVSPVYDPIRRGI